MSKIYSRSLVISYKLLGTREWFVIHHSNCGMELFTDDTATSPSTAMSITWSRAA
jgi:carbonic anhydrase